MLSGDTNLCSLFLFFCFSFALAFATGCSLEVSVCCIGVSMWMLLVSKGVTAVLSSMPHRPRCGAVGDFRLRPWRFGGGRCDEDNCRERPGRHASRWSRSDWELLFAVTFLSTGSMVERSLPVLYRCSQFLRREASHRTSSASSLLNHKRPRDLTTPSNTELFLGFCCH